MAIEVVNESEVDAEGIILTSMVVSDRFCAEISPNFKEEYFESKYARMVARWVLKYFKKFNKAPGKTIENMYKVEKRNLDKPTAKLIRTFLRSLSRQYESVKSINIDYNIDFAKKFFHERALEILFEEGKNLIELGRYERAGELLDGFRKVEKFTGNRIAPFSSQQILAYGREMEDSKLFRFDGVLGDYLGDFCRSWLVSWVGPEKRGKSWWLLESVFQAISKGVKTVLFSLEMNEVSLKNRIYKRLTGMADEKDILNFRGRGYDYLRFPIFDCAKNQLGTCMEKHCSESPLIVNEKRLDFTPGMRYKPCDYCRVNKIWTKYRPAYFFTSVDLDKIRILSRRDVVVKAKSFERRFGDNLRIKCYPAFSASFSDVKRDLDAFAREGFIASLIAIDYPDIMAKEEFRYVDNERASINATWQGAKNLADTTNTCLMVCDQATRKARERRSIKKIDTSEDKRKDAHLDMKITINQTDDESNDGVSRIGLMYHRHMRVEEYLQCMALQQLTVAQPYLDAELWMERGSVRKKDEKKERRLKPLRAIKL